MKISINWLKSYINIEESNEAVAEMLTRSGLEVEGMEKYDQVKGGLEGLIIGEVESCEQHPNADKLKLARVKTSPEERASIVCGAPNVASGQKVVVAPAGTTLYPYEGEPFQVKKSKIRGEKSEGMICAEDEIGLGPSHNGIMVLDTHLPPGTPVNRYFNFESDYILEIGLTPNRADAASHIGVARELKALLNRPVYYPEVDNFQVDNHDFPIEVKVENQEACPRYSGITIANIQVGPSPEWLKNKMASIGIGSINNIVDITNFVLHELGQPLHAFDADKIEGNQVIITTLPEQTPFTTLDEKERKLKAYDLMICNSRDGMCIAGVFGGLYSGVTEKTTNIFLESAYFNPAYIRKTAQHHGLKTDASFRYERGTDPNITVYALKRAAQLIKEIAGGTISSDIVDIYPNPIAHFKVPVQYKNIHRLIGKNLQKNTIQNILNLLEIQIQDETPEGFTALVPPFKVDVQREADIIEEILRIYGYDNIETEEYLKSDYLASFPEVDPDRVKNQLREQLAGSGFREIITNSLTNPAFTQKIRENAGDTYGTIEIVNKLSEELGVLRHSLLFSGLEVIKHNLNRKQFNLKFFEFGKIYRENNGQYEEDERLAVFMSGNTEDENWQNTTQPVDFYHLSKEVRKIFDKFNVGEVDQEIFQDSLFNYGLKCKIGKEQLAIISKVKKPVLNEVEIKQEVFYADINWPLLYRQIANKEARQNLIYEEISRFPEVRRDLSLVIDNKVTFDNIKEVADKNSNQLLKQVNVFDVYMGEQIPEGKKAYALSFTLQDQEKTLTEKVIDKTMTQLMQAFENQLGAVIRQ